MPARSRYEDLSIRLVVDQDLAANEDLSIRQNNDVIGRAFCAEIEAEKPVRAKSCIGATVRIKAEQSESEGQRYFSLPAHKNLTVRLNSTARVKTLGRQVSPFRRAALFSEPRSFSGRTKVQRQSSQADDDPVL